METIDQAWTKKDYFHIGLSIVITLIFSIRGGELPGAIFVTVRYLLAYYLYGVVMVLMFVGLMKKMFKYKPNKKKMVLWVFYIATFFAVTEMIHEGFLMLTGQEFH